MIDRVGAGALPVSLIGDAPAPLATTSHAHWHAAARRRRSWLILRTPLRIPSAPFMTLREVRDEGAGGGSSGCSPCRGSQCNV